MSIFALITEAVKKDAQGAIKKGTDVIDSFAIAKCKGTED